MITLATVVVASTLAGCLADQEAPPPASPPAGDDTAVAAPVPTYSVQGHDCGTLTGGARGPVEKKEGALLVSWTRLGPPAEDFRNLTYTATWEPENPTTTEMNLTLFGENNVVLASGEGPSPLVLRIEELPPEARGNYEISYRFTLPKGPAVTVQQPYRVSWLVFLNGTGPDIQETPPDGPVDGTREKLACRDP